jgi:hypothetical protein
MCHPFAGSTRATHGFRDYEKKPMVFNVSDAFRGGMTRYKSSEEQQIEPVCGEHLPGDKDDENQVGDTSIETVVSMNAPGPETDTLVMNPRMASAKWEAEITAIIENPSQINEIDLKCVKFVSLFLRILT